jgi:hypothetical protein
MSNSDNKTITQSDLDSIEVEDRENFIEVENQIQKHQHDTVENAVNGYVTDMRIDEGDVIAEVEVPAYDETIEETVAEVNGRLNYDSNLASYVDDVERIADLVSHNPIPVRRHEILRNDESIIVEKNDTDTEIPDPPLLETILLTIVFLILFALISPILIVLIVYILSALVPLNLAFQVSAFIMHLAAMVSYYYFYKKIDDVFM